MSRVRPQFPFRLGAAALLAAATGVRGQLFEAAAPLPGVTTGESVVAGDFNGDGRIDLVVITNQNTADILYINEGNRVFSAMALPESPDGLGADVGDLNGDGLLDIFVATPSTHDFYYRNEGNFAFTVRLLNQAGINSTVGTGAVVRDFDRDGKLDVAVSTSGNTRDVWYRNTGNDGSGFALFSQSLLPLPSGFSGGTPGADVAAGDFNGDGLLDIYVTTSTNKEIFYHQGAGATFAAATTSSSPAGDGCAAGRFLSGVNKDLGFLAGGSTQQNDLVFRHSSGTSYSSITVSSTNQSSIVRAGAAVGDLNLDGKVDVFVARMDQADFVYLNNSSANLLTLTVDPFRGSSGKSRDVVLADLDADGDLDAAVASTGPGGTADFVYYNTTATPPPAPDTDGDGVPDDVDSDDDNDGVPDHLDPAPLNPFLCGDSDGDGCDDCAIGRDGFGPLSDVRPEADGPDQDGDGLCDGGDPDQDGDGMPNAWEIANGLNPALNDALADKDGDGLSNLLEYQTGRNPSVRDSDGDGLPDGWEYHQFATNQVKIVPEGEVWRFLDNGTNPGANYTLLSYDDALWKTGRAPLGYGEPGLGTLIGFGPNPDQKHIATFFRRKFAAFDVAAIQSATLSYVRDDGVRIMLNGAQVALNNLPSSPTFTTLASSVIEGAAESVVHSASLPPGAFLNGENVVAAQVHQHTANSPDLFFKAWITLTYPARQAHPDLDNDGDGATNLQEYISGTNPNDSASVGPRLSYRISPTGQQQFVFTAVAAQGAGYSGLTRYYTVEFLDPPGGTVWQPLAGKIDIPATGQIVEINISGNSRYYRTRAELR
jgi:hypothetical protein